MILFALFNLFYSMFICWTYFFAIWNPTVSSTPLAAREQSHKSQFQSVKVKFHSLIFCEWLWHRPAHSTTVVILRFSGNQAETTYSEKDRKKISESILQLSLDLKVLLYPHQQLTRTWCKIWVIQGRSPKFLQALKEFEVLPKSELTPKPSINKGEKITGKGMHHTLRFLSFSLETIEFQSSPWWCRRTAKARSE